MIKKQQSGFTLVELMITMVIFVLAIAAVSNIFTGILTQFKQQTKIAESNIEGIVGLELLRYDVENAGYGLPWNINGITTYTEAADDTNTTWNDTSFNDATTAVPRAIVLGNSVGMQIGANTQSDVLVIKAANIATNAVAQKWTYITNTGANNVLRTWTDATEALAGTDRVIIIDPKVGSRERVLINSGSTFFIRMNQLPSFGGTATAFEPVASTSNSFIVYGIDAVDLRMPFNRADYYIRNPVTTMPTRCEPSTGVLYKATINHANGLHTEFPLLDCVAYFKVVVVLDVNNDGNLTITTATPANAAFIRSQIRQVRIYIVAHEGQLDTTYTSPTTITIPDGIPPFAVPNQNYRWKLYTLVITPYGLRE